jgi:hypothetical protein
VAEFYAQTCSLNRICTALWGSAHRKLCSMLALKLQRFFVTRRYFLQLSLLRNRFD